MNPTLTYVTRVLKNASDDPMWAHHCELSKSTIRTALELLYRAEDLERALSTLIHDIRAAAEYDSAWEQVEIAYDALRGV